MNVSSQSTVVVGAGPYGLAVAAHLRGRGVPVRVFGEPMQLWSRHMPKGMYLKSEPAASTISAPTAGYTLADYCTISGRPSLGQHGPVPIELFIEYGQWFQEQLVPVEQERVVCVAPVGDGFAVTLESGEVVAAKSVVMAAGHLQFAYVPEVLQAVAGGAPLPTERISHACHHTDLSALGDSTIAVIGAGQSALETAALAHEAGAQVDILVRGSRVRWAGTPKPTRSLRERLTKPNSPMGPGWSLAAAHRGAAWFRVLPASTRLSLVRSVLGPAGSWWLRDRVEGVIDIHLDTEVRNAWTEGDKVVLECVGANASAPSRLVVDHVIAATGYRVAPGAIRFLDRSLLDRVELVGGFPKLNRSYQSTVPGLYFAGLSSAAMFGPFMRFVCGTELAAPRIARGIAAAR